MSRFFFASTSIVKTGIYCIIFSTLFIESVYGQDDLHKGLVGCYSFTNNTNDASGFNNNGVNNGASLTADRFGVANSAYAFDGNQSFIALPVNAFRNNAYSYSVWANSAIIPAYGDVGNVISVGTSDGHHQVINLANVYASAEFIGWDAGAFNNGNPPTSSAETTTLPSAQQWYHLVSTRDDSSIKLYVNGTLAATTSTNGTDPSYLGDVFANIGIRCNFTQPFNGLIDDVAIYNRVLNSNEVYDLYVNGLPCPLEVKVDANNVSQCGEGSFMVLATGGNVYNWYDAAVGGNLLFTGNPFQTPVLSQSTSYYVTATIGVTVSERKKVDITIYSQPVIACNFPAEINLGEPVTLLADIESGTPPFIFNWSNGDGMSLTTQTNSQDYTYSNDGSYKIEVSVKDINGCLTSCEGTIKVDFDPFIPNVITVNGDSLNTTLTLYSATRNGFLKYPGDEPFLLTVFDRWGKEVFSTIHALQGWRGQNASAGVYFYRVVAGDNTWKGWVHVVN